MVKKNDEDVEVADGLKGRIIPFELVQKVKFQADLVSIAELQSRVETISGKLEEIHESFTEEEIEAYCDSEKDNNPFDKKAIASGAKPKADVEPETKSKLKQIVSLLDDQTKTNKQIKSDKQALEKKTIEAIQNFTDAEVAQFLHLKWITPVCEGIDGTLTNVLSALEYAVLTMGEKYAVSYKQINEEIVSSKNELAEFIAQLSGDEYAINGLTELFKG